ILSWISPLESWKRHRDVVGTRVKGIGEWVLKTGQFQAWRRGGSDETGGRILFCHGAPGAGKTFICSLVIDTLCDGTAGPNVAVGCLYCDYRGQKEQTAEVMIGSLLRQFVTGLPEIPEAIKQAFREAKKHLGGRPLELVKTIELFQVVLGHFQRVFICVDALDEIVAEYGAPFLRSLRQILDRSPNVRLFLTARPHIQSKVEGHIPLNGGIIAVRPLCSDIENFLAAKLDTDPCPEAMDDDLRSEIMTKIPGEASEVNAYTATLQRIKGQNGALARIGTSALMWISLAERPLLVDELCHALAMEVGSPNIDAEMIPPIQTVVASCMGLVTTDPASSTVRLVHATLEEYLRSHHENLFQNAHSTITEVCLSYMSIQSVRELPPDLTTGPPEFPLLGYASCYWGGHARKELAASVSQLALRILDQYPQHAAANIFLQNGGSPRVWSCFNSEGFSGLHYVSYWGIDELVEKMVSTDQANLNKGDSWGRTPLILAAARGNEGVVRSLINCAGLDPNCADEDGRTPLNQASANGHEGVVTMLLNCTRVSPDSATGAGGTPLHQASANGHEGVVRMLLSRDD
ncbi:unnamed protein product, partial [Tuber aestivum]